MTKPSFYKELQTWTLLSFALAMTESGVLGFITKKYFEGTIDTQLLDWCVGAIAAAPPFANILSFIFAKYSIGKPKVNFIFKLQIVVCIFIILSAFIPQSKAGLLLLLIFPALGSRIAWSGIATLRTGIWRANYPNKIRAQITSKLAVAQGITLAAVALITGVLLNYFPQIFKILFPLCGMIGIFGAFKYRRIRVRKEKNLISQELNNYKSKLVKKYFIRQTFLMNKDFCFYMCSMFLFGLGNIMVGAPLLIVLNDQFEVSYFTGITITTVIPTALLAITAPLWSKIFDSMHIIEFRRIHCWCFLISTLLMTMGSYFHVLGLFVIALIFRGIGFGGGVLAWNLGHHDFANSSNSTNLMGIHVTLTGIRGLIAPLLGVGIFQYSLKNFNDPFGFRVFIISLVISLLGSIGFFLQKTQKSRSDSL